MLFSVHMFEISQHYGMHLIGTHYHVAVRVRRLARWRTHGQPEGKWYLVRGQPCAYTPFFNHAICFGQTLARPDRLQNLMQTLSDKTCFESYLGSVASLVGQIKEKGSNLP